MTAQPVKYRSVSITVYPITRTDGNTYWQFKRRDGSRVTRATLSKAKSDALREAQLLFKGGLEISDLTPDQIRAIKRMLEADPELRMVDEFLLWHSRRAPKKNLGDALDEFLAAKLANQGRSAQHIKTLRALLKPLEPLRGMPLSSVAVNDLPDLTGEPRTRKNQRGAWVTFFKWCAEMEYLPHGEKTAPERLGKPIARRKVPATYTPAELRVLLGAVDPAFLPWLACGAFAGTRTDELFPLRGGEKSPLDWSDFDWPAKIIRIRPETDKNGHRRIVPIHPALRAWLYPVRKKSGPLLDAAPSGGRHSETVRIGKLIGGWKANALRHSYISYRAAEVGLAVTSMECGNSESEARKSYNDSKAPEEAREWFGVMPGAE